MFSMYFLKLLIFLRVNFNVHFIKNEEKGFTLGTADFKILF